jgi:hypothetical protein
LDDASNAAFEGGNALFYPGEMGEGDPPGPTVTGCFRKIHHEGTKGTKRAKEAESLAPEGFFSFLPPAFPCLLSALCAFVVTTPGRFTTKARRAQRGQKRLKALLQKVFSLSCRLPSPVFLVLFVPSW